MNIYEKALEILRERGWNQGHSKGPDGSVCVIRAVGEAARALGIDKRPFGELQSQLDASLLGCTKHEHRLLYHWNDCSNTTEEDVRLLLKHAAVEVGE